MGSNLRWAALALAIAAVSLAVFGSACGDGDGGDGDGDAAEVEAMIQAAVDAWNGKDVEGFLAFVTDNWLQTEGELTREEAPAAFADFIGDPPIEIPTISDVEVSGDTATAVYKQVEGNLVSRLRGSFVRVDGAWKVDAEEDLGAEIPAGVTAIDLKTTEYKFNFDAAAISDGNIAFNVSNIGGEQHFVVLSKVPEDLDIEAALQSDEEPAGVEDVGETDVLDPGDETTLVFADPLGPGRYVMLCFVEAADGEPHALKGMWAEFTVP